MNVRAVAGLVMLLVAAGLLTVFFVSYDRNADLVPARDPAGAEAGQAATPGLPPREAGVDSFLAAYNAAFADLWTAAQRTAFAACLGTGASLAGHEGGQAVGRADSARAAWREFTGDQAVIARLRDLRDRTDLADLQSLQVESAWRIAARHPGTAPRATDRLLSLQAAAAESLAAATYAPAFTGRTATRISYPELVRMLLSCRDPRQRQDLWEARLEPGSRLKESLAEMRDLRNAAARAMGYTSFFDLQAADLGLGSAQLLQLMDRTLDGVMPLYRELHGWTRATLADRYRSPVPTLLPASWLGLGAGQGWFDLAPASSPVDPRAAAAEAEDFFASLGFGRLPESFWQESRFGLPAAAGLPRTAAWHIDRAQDVRLLQVGSLDREGWRLLRGEIGRCYTFMFCGRPQVPPLLREEPGRALGEGLAGLLSLAAAGSAGPGPTQDEFRSVPPQILPLLEEALGGPVAWLPYAAGTAAHWEYDFYELDLPRHLLNTRWWEYAARFQGLVPPSARDERFCDPACAEGFLTDPATTGQQALGAVITHQLHRYLCRQVLGQDVHAADYRGSLQAGDFLRSLMARGRTRPWAQVLREATGEEISPDALVEYFEPLRVWLAEQNRGRQPGF